MGPGAGDEGGRIVTAGTPRDVAQSKHSRTAPYLAEFHQRRSSKTDGRKGIDV
jgi:excinuclease ABC subunit A